MLTELHIENFAIIENLDLQLESGLITFTGETGAGKSILIDAVETLLGGRAEVTLIRSGAQKAIIEGSFEISPSMAASIHPILEREDLLDDPGYLVLNREIRANGRSISRVNGRSVQASFIKELGIKLVDIHGQSEHLSLLQVNHHIELLDKFANAETELEKYKTSYKKLIELKRKLNELRQQEQDATRKIDLLKYQINEIEAAHLQTDEETGLREEHNRLANAENLSQSAHIVLQLIDEGSPEMISITDLNGQVLHELNNLTRLDQSQNHLVVQAQSAFEQLSDTAYQLRNYLESIEFNPKRLQQIEERIALIQTLKRKYGASISAVLEFLSAAKNEIETITHAGELIQQLEDEEQDLLVQLAKDGEALSKKRREHADLMAAQIENELNELSMENVIFKVDFKDDEDAQGILLSDGRKVTYDSTGFEQVEFLIAPNPGEGLKPLVKIASGGETSRLMLALKNVLASADPVPTLIFDEIDQGIGGRVGNIVGQKLWRLSNKHQVLCITHLPQLAAFGNQHLHVYKLIHEGRTITKIEALESEKRLRELALMFGEISEGTLQSARDLLSTVSKTTSIE
ncbi:MAG: DNA repair protein RecN [Anaerolineales bacterium]|nr:DNA repair protein RecN [Anaerolineales bacterium]